MKRYSFAAGLALAVVVVLGIAGPVTAGEQVPFQGSLEGDVTRGVPDGDYIDIVVVGSGDATQLGKYTFFNPHTVHSPSSTGEGIYHIVAANGDTLTADSTGFATPMVIDGVFHLLIMETQTITGGTGRFAGATGSFTIERLYNPASGLTVGSFEGTISTPGASNP